MKRFFSYIKANAPRFFKWLLGVFTRRLPLKLISLVLALIVWTYIINTNSSLTRVKYLNNLSVSAGNVTVLSGNSLSLATDTAVLNQTQYTVSVELPQNRYSELTARNIRLTPDYSAIRTAGTYDVPLVASSTYGDVVKITPATVRVEIESTDSRNLSTEVELVGADNDAYWYNVDTSVLNPGQITVSGPASLVQTVSHVIAEVDVSERTANFRRSTKVNLSAQDGTPIESGLLNKSSSTCLVRVEVYPKKTLGVYADPAQIKLKEGFEVTDISFQPSTITVAGESELLAGIEYLPLETGSIQEEADNTFTTRLSFGGLDDFKYVSARNVYMTVTVEEKTVTRVFKDVPVELISGEGAKADAALFPVCDVTVTGPYRAVNALTSEDLICTAVFEEAEGEVSVPVSVSVDGAAENLIFEETFITPAGGAQ